MSAAVRNIGTSLELCSRLRKEAQSFRSNKPSFFALAALKGRTFLFAIALLLLLGTASALAQPILTATLDRDTVTLGERAILTLVFEGGQPDQAPMIQVPQGLTVQPGETRREFRMVNGQTTFAYKLSYAVVPTQAGEFAIPPIQAVVSRQRILTQPIKLHVLKQNTPAASDTNPLSRYAFLKLIVLKTNVFLGEVMPLEIQLYFAVGGDQLQTPQVQSEGFSFGPIVASPQNQNPPSVQIGNVPYRVLSFKMTATALKSGTLTLGPAQCSLVLRIPTNRRSGDLFEDFFGPREQRAPVTLTSQPQPIEVLPLPEANKPAGFSGAVGNYQWSVAASPTDVATGDPITLKIQIAGQGALDTLALPAFDWHEFKSYPPTSQVKMDDPLGSQGTKSFEQVVVPQNADVKEIPALAFSFFDPAQKVYRTLTHGPIPLAVKPSSGGQPQPTVLAGSASTGQTSAQIRDIAHIKPYLGHLATMQPALIQQPWFLALQSVPLFAWLAAWGWRKRQDALANNPKLRRRQEVAGLVRKGLQVLKRLADEDNAEEFFATAFRLLQEQLGERSDLPASSITEAVIDERLRPMGVSEELMSEVHELFQACNQARYAGHASARELNALVPRVEAALRELQNVEQ